MTVIDLDNVSLRFNLNAAGRVPLKDRFVRFFSGQSPPRRHVDAVKNMTVKIRAGERVGLIGGNGAGKSSLLRLMAGIYQPTAGKLIVDGKIDSMLDLGIGVEPEATGWKNIAYRCYLRGETPDQMNAKRQQIAEFSELGDHLNTLVRYYSTGMTVRLLFALATAIDPDVLLIDEVLSAGDLGFVDKARRRMIELIEKARVLVCASHDLSSLSELCTRVLWIRQGEIVADARPDEVIREYKLHMCQRATVPAEVLAEPQAAAAATADASTEGEGQTPLVPDRSWPHDTLVEEIRDVCFRKGGYPDAWLRHAACPCCGSKQFEPAFSKYEISHSICRQCQFTFVDPYPSEEILNRLYNGSYYTAVRELVERPKARSGDPESSLSVETKYLEPLIEEVAKHRTRGAWLDVGGGVGAFCALVRSRMPGFEVFLNESSKRSCELARELYDVQTVEDRLDQVRDRGQRFDVVSAVAVLEHVTKPQAFVRSMLEVLNPGGILVLHLPRFSPLNRLISRGSSAVIVPPFHVSLFDEHNLATMLRTVEELESTRIWTDGPPAFEMKHFLQYGDMWDLRIPKRVQTSVENIQLQAFSPLEQEFLNYLATGDRAFAPRIAEVDGRVLLNAVAVKSPVARRVDEVHASGRHRPHSVGVRSLERIAD